jgi:hypothetical protein
MATTKRLLEGALRKIGVLAAGEEAEPSELQDALEIANEWLDSLSNEGLLIYALTHESFQLTSSRTYTIGLGGDFDTVRPTTIEDVRIRDAGGLEEPVEIASLNKWSGIRIKDAVLTYPDYIYYEPTFPLGTLYLSAYPVENNYLLMVTTKPLTALPALTVDVDLPPGYLRFIRLGLAVELAPEFGKTIDPVIAATFRQATAVLKRTNSKSRMGTLEVDKGLLQRRRGYDVTQGPGQGSF